MGIMGYYNKVAINKPLSMQFGISANCTGSGSHVMFTSCQICPLRPWCSSTSIALLSILQRFLIIFSIMAQVNANLIGMTMRGLSSVTADEATCRQVTVLIILSPIFHLWISDIINACRRHYTKCKYLLLIVSYIDAVSLLLFQWMRDNGLLARVQLCQCGQVMVESGYTRSIDDQLIWRCRGCRLTANLRKGSFFERSKLTLTQLTDVMYWWAHETHNFETEFQVWTIVPIV